MNRSDPPRQPIRSRLGTSFPDGLIRAGTWGIADQSVISGTNFIVMIVAARSLGPASFGTFALLFTVLVFMEMVQRSLITAPHNVLGVGKSGDEYRTYTSSTAALQVSLALVFGALSVATGVVIQIFDAALGYSVVAMGLAAIAWQVHEFARRVLFTEFRIPAALVVDVATYVTRIAIVAVLVLSIGLSGPRLMLAYACTWLIGAIFGVWLIRQSLQPRFDREVIREHWEFGRWLFASNVASYLPRYVAAAVLSSFLSVAAYGGYRAFEQLSNAANVPLTAINNVLRPRMARDASHGPRAVWQTMLPVMALGGAALALFAVALIVVRGPLVSAIYGSEYTEFTAALFLIALFPSFILQKSLLTNALQAFRDTRPIFVASAVSASLGSVLGAVAIVTFGLAAAGSIMVLSGLFAVGWLAWVWKRYLSDEENWQDEQLRVPEASVHS